MVWWAFVLHLVSSASADEAACVQSSGKCGGNSWVAEGNPTECCTATESCFVKSASYSQCRVSCPDNDDWACNTPQPTTVPTPQPSPTPTIDCADAMAKCGGGENYNGPTKCCDEAYSCFARDSTYSQCRTSCKTGAGWACDTPSPTSQPSPLPTLQPTAIPTPVPTNDCSYTYIACGETVGAGADPSPRLDGLLHHDYFLPLLT